MQRDDGLKSGSDEAKPKRTAAPRRRPASGGAAQAPRSTARAAARPGALRQREAAAARPAAGATGVVPPPRMLVKYRQEVRPALVREFSYKSVMQAPVLEKVVLNMGLGEALTNARALETAPEQMATIAGQKPVITKAHRSVAAFKVREGMSIGCAVTIRGRRMWEFMDRFLSVVLPRIRDFRGVPRASFDGQGNYAVGIREQLIFPEIDFNKLDRIRGLQLSIVTTARSDREGFRMLELLGMPFAREGQGR